MTLAGQQLGHYRLIRLIKQGGMGEVYLAEDTRISRQVAIKVVHNEHQSYPDSKASQKAQRLFQREMKAISQLDHPHILSFYDFGEEPATNGSIIYMVMPYRPEGSLLHWLLQRKSRLLPPLDVGHMISQAASALQHAHDHNIVHQDVKPSNFLVRANADHPTRPDLFLVDFGIARVMSATSTTSSSIRGTTSYMAPEQWSGNAVPASDQYALATMSYLLLTGQHPFQGRPEQMMFRHLTEPPKPPSQLNSLLSPSIDAVILRALAKEKDERFPTIKAFAMAFQQALNYTGITPLPNNLAPVYPQSRASLPSGTVNNRSTPSKQRTLVFMIVALLLLMVGSVLAVASVNNTIAANNAAATATTLSILQTNATATWQAIANSTATAIAANPDPYQPPAGTLALLDQLSQPDVWGNALDTSSGDQCQFVNGGYQISQPQQNKLYQCYEGNQYSNFAFEVKMTIKQGDCGGLAIRSQNNNTNLYLFQVCQDGSFDFYQYTSNSVGGPITLTHNNSPAIKQGIGQLNTIAVVANGNTFTLYINNQKVASASDSTYTQGSIGLVASAYNNPTTVTYQNARVWTIR